jgi:hypothetical protein
MKKITACLLMLWFSGNVYGFGSEKTQIHGFVSQGYLKSDTNNYFFANTQNGTFEFNEFGINIISDPSDNLRIGIQVLSKDLGQFGNNDPQIDWAYGDYRFRNWLGIRAGKIKTATGLYNQVRDVDAGRSCIFLPHSLYNEAVRDVTVAMTGFSLYGTLAAGFEYEFQLGKWEIFSDGAVATTLATALKIPVNDIDTDTVDDTLNFHLEWHPRGVSGLRIAGTYLTNLEWDIKTPLISFSYEVHQFISSAEYIHNNLTLAAEYSRTYVDRAPTEIMPGKYSEKEMYYGMASYLFTDWFEAGTYYSVLYSDADDRDGNIQESEGKLKEMAWLKDFAVFARFDINPNWIVKLEGHYIDGLAEILDASSGDLSDTGFLFAVKTTFSF